MNRVILTKIKQSFPDNALTDIRREVQSEITRFIPFIEPGASIAIAVGSRGINNQAIIVREVAEFVKKKGAFPFIIPAMGSHGNASAEGQKDILAGYGITEETIGIPVKSSMEVVELPQGSSPVQVFMDKNAWEADGVILINRIKPHTDFHSRFESGLVKMAVIGLGKERQASAIHSFGVFGLTDILPQTAKEIFASGKILGGIAMIENAYDKTMLIKALRADEIIDKEPLLLEIARKNMPSLPVNDIDILIIDRMGKDISGVGIDPNIIGRIKISGQKEPTSPAIKAIVVNDLTDESHGNAIGMGLSDVITRRLYDKIDFSSTYVNVITSSFLERAKTPVVAANEREAFDIAVRSCGYLEPNREKIIRVKNTLNLDEMYVSEAILEMLKGMGSITIPGEGKDIFNNETDLIPF